MENLPNLESLITDTDTNQECLAEEIKVSSRQIRRWIKGDAEMGIFKLKAICDYYKISADCILGLPSYYAKSIEEVIKKNGMDI